MKPSILRFTALFCVVCLLFVFAVVALSGNAPSLHPSIITDFSGFVKNNEDDFTVILDAGHGGEDGGASAADGTLEKDLNLALTLRARDLLRACGVNVVLTREDDRMLGNGGAGRRKAEDLRARLEIANSNPDALLISIHMNKFPLSYCRGVQLFYSGNNPDSALFAQSLHELVKKRLQNDNEREIKEATSAIYLLDRAKNPAVLIECGFLSNEEEKTLLKSEEYQNKLAALILSALSDYKEKIKKT